MDGYYDVSGVIKLVRRRRSGGGEAGDWQIQAGADDGYSKSDGTFNDNADWLDIGKIGGLIYDSFAWWDNINIPQGATITAAYITIVGNLTGNDGANTLSNLYFENSDDAVAPTDQAEHAADTRTTAFVAWDGQDFLQDVEYNSPDISVVVKEVVDRGSWASGNAMMLLWDDDGSNEGKLYQPSTYDRSSAQAPKLHVEWSS